MTLFPIQQSFPTLMPFLVTPCSYIDELPLKLWFSAIKLTPAPIWHFSPMINRAAAPKLHLGPM